MTTHGFVVAIALAALAACASNRSPVRAAPRTTSAPGSSLTVAVPDKLLVDLAMMAHGAPPTLAEMDLARGRLARGEGNVESYVSELLADPRFARDVAPEILVQKKAVDIAEEDTWEVLESTRATPSSPKVFYLRKPCDAKVAEKVHPWWALDTEVLVCPDAHQPNHLRDAKTGWYCGGDNLDPARSPFCGCGPNLITCARDDEHAKEMRHGLRSEVQKTIAYVVERDAPLAYLFTMNATVRTASAELFYERARVMRGELGAVTDLRAWPTEGKLAPRTESAPGQHAGILTTPHLLLFGDTPRARMRNFYEHLWCAPPASVRVTAAGVLGLGVTDLRDGDGWRKLAAMPVCTACHARLDFGMQFFAGYPSSFAGVVFSPHGAPGARGALYADGIGDPRGEAELTPHGFATLAVAQREFGACMAKDVLEHVFNDAATPDDTRALAEAFASKATLKSLAYAALVRYAQRVMTDAGPVPLAIGTSRFDASDLMTPSPALRQRLAKQCGACHAGGSPPALARDATLASPLVREILKQVAFGQMPKGRALDANDRTAIVRELVGALFADDAARAQATRYFEEGARTLPMHRESALLRLVTARAGAQDADVAAWSLVDTDRHDVATYTPSVALSFTLAALRTCKAAGNTGDALDACVRSAADVEAAFKSRP